jgi:predicted aspartyl protease
MTNKLLKMIGVLAFLTIPTSITEMYQVPQIKPRYNTEVKIPKEKIKEYKITIEEITKEISVLNKEKDFFLGRLKQDGSIYAVKNEYLKNMKKINEKILKNEEERDSLYDLLKK